MLPSVFPTVKYMLENTAKEADMSLCQLKEPPRKNIILPNTLKDMSTPEVDYGIKAPPPWTY